MQFGWCWWCSRFINLWCVAIDVHSVRVLIVDLRFVREIFMQIEDVHYIRHLREFWRTSWPWLMNQPVRQLDVVFRRRCWHFSHLWSQRCSDKSLSLFTVLIKRRIMFKSFKFPSNASFSQLFLFLNAHSFIYYHVHSYILSSFTLSLRAFKISTFSPLFSFAKHFVSNSRKRFEMAISKKFHRFDMKKIFPSRSFLIQLANV